MTTKLVSYSLTLASKYAQYILKPIMVADVLNKTKTMENILFICSANKDRSKTAEDYFSKKFPDGNFDSAGINRKTCNQFGTN